MSYRENKGKNVMNIKKSYVYRSIRMAAAQSLLSLWMLRFCIYVVLLVLLITNLLFGFDSDKSRDFNGPLFFFVACLIVYLAFETTGLIRIVIALIIPEKGTTATRYADIISFAEMCERVESQRLHPISHMEYWGISPLADFIIIERYGVFNVIPYSAIQEVLPWWPIYITKHDVASQRCAIAIQDTLSNRYVIICDDRDEKEKLICALNNVLQKVRKEGNYL